jgi:hypothetical protein
MYAFHLDVPMPIALYDQVQQELKSSGKATPAERLLHICAATADGFRVTEIWESHEAVDRYGEEVMRPTIAKIAGEEAVAGGPPPNQDFDLHGLQWRGEWIGL